jgi:hypothetical protein
VNVTAAAGEGVECGVRRVTTAVRAAERRVPDWTRDAARGFERMRRAPRFGMPVTVAVYLPAMPARSVRFGSLLATCLLAHLATGCAEPPRVAPPAAEFLIAAGDSTYWVRSVEDGLRLRGSPILLATFGGRFYEVYVTDDDRSYEDAVFVGQRVWRRDLVRGDSVLVFEDTLVPRLSRRWAAEHPDARLLEPAEPESPEPVAAATAEVTVIAVHGPYLSYEYHADVESDDVRPWHTTRRGVVDLRSGRQVTVGDLFGRDVARRALGAAQRQFRDAVDSLGRARRGRAAELARSIRRLELDAASFAIEGDAGAPAVAFFVPGRGEGAAGDVAIPVAPVAVPVPAWWADVRHTLPEDTGELPVDRWTHGGVVVTAEEEADDRAHVTLADARRVWPVGDVQAPVHHILWLDSPAVDSATRRGLTRAFNEAVFYDETTRTAAHDAPAVPPRPRCTLTRLAARKSRA